MKYLLRTMLFAVCALLVVQINAASQNDRFVSQTETVQGQIWSVDVQNQLVIVKTADGTFFDLQIRPTTKIEVGGANGKIENLADRTGKRASVTFRTLRTGDLALKIEVQ